MITWTDTRALTHHESHTRTHTHTLGEYRMLFLTFMQAESKRLRVGPCRGPFAPVASLGKDNPSIRLIVRKVPVLKHNMEMRYQLFRRMLFPGKL